MLEAFDLLLANSGSPLMFQYAALQAVGNLVIGICEGLLIAAVFRVSAWKSMGALILANYASGLGGILLFGVFESPTPIMALFPEPLYVASILPVIFLAVALLFSLLIEWPFCYWIAPKANRKRIITSIRMVLLAQVVSYSCLTILFAGSLMPTSSRVHLKDVDIVRILELPPSSMKAWVYYIDRDDGDVYRVRPDGSNAERVHDLGLRDWQSLLYVLDEFLFEDERAAQSDQLHICAWPVPSHDDNLMRLFSVSRPRATPFLYLAAFDDYKYSGMEQPGSQAAFSIGVADLRSPDDRVWYAEPRGTQGLRVRNRQTGASYRIQFDTLVNSWKVRNLSVLTDDIAIFEFGPQICVLDIGQRRITVLARGMGPVVVLDE